MPHCEKCNEWKPTPQGLARHYGSEKCKRQALRTSQEDDGSESSTDSDQETAQSSSDSESLASITSESGEPYTQDDLGLGFDEPEPAVPVAQKRKTVWIEEEVDDSDNEGEEDE